MTTIRFSAELLPPEKAAGIVFGVSKVPHPFVGNTYQRYPNNGGKRITTNAPQAL
jgi:hypothetical protein